MGSEYAFKSGLGGSAPAAYGISSSGFGIFGPQDRFDTHHLLTPPPNGEPDGCDWAITSAGDDLKTRNGGYGTSTKPIVQDQVVITLTNWTLGLDPSTAISHVWFQYGTSLNGEPGCGGNMITAVPLPAPQLMAAVGMGVLCARRRRRT